MSLIIVIIFWSILDSHLMITYYLRNKKAIEYIEDKGHHYDIDGDGFYDLGEEDQEELLKILKGKKQKRP